MEVQAHQYFFLPYFDKCCLIVDVCLCSRPDVELSSTMKVSEKWSDKQHNVCTHTHIHTAYTCIEYHDNGHRSERKPVSDMWLHSFYHKSVECIVDICPITGDLYQLHCTCWEPEVQSASPTLTFSIWFSICLLLVHPAVIGYLALAGVQVQGLFSWNSNGPGRISSHTTCCEERPVFLWAPGPAENLHWHVCVWVCELSAFKVRLRTIYDESMCEGL